MRVGTVNVLRPLSFLLFIIRQRYPSKWRTFVGISDAEVLCRSIRDNLDGVPEEYRSALDEWEMALH
jgi:hypothetical protein